MQSEAYILSFFIWNPILLTHLHHIWEHSIFHYDVKNWWKNLYGTGLRIFPIPNSTYILHLLMLIYIDLHWRDYIPSLEDNEEFLSCNVPHIVHENLSIYLYAPLLSYYSHLRVSWTWQPQSRYLLNTSTRVQQYRKSWSEEHIFLQQ